MQRPLFAVAAIVALSSLASDARAVWFDDGARYVKHGYKENSMWPWPYVCADRIAVREPFCIMINNGWRRQNLLGPQYFTEAGQLNSAGELRVRWIMTQAPPNRRTIFVERDLNPTVTADRVAAIRNYSTQVAPTHIAQIVESDLMSEGRPAAIVDATNVRFQESQPPPVLPASQALNGDSP